jgi:enterochelin esterase-like enzyme
VRFKPFVPLVSAALVAAVAAVHAAQSTPDPARCHPVAVVSLAPDLARGPVSGRLFVFLARKDSVPPDAKELGPSFFQPEAAYMAAVEVRNLEPGRTVTIDASALAFPGPLASAPAAEYRAQALLDLDHSYAYSGPGDGDLRSAVVDAGAFQPGTSAPVALTLASRVDDPEPADTESTRHVTFVSPVLSAFWGRPVEMRAGVVLPPSYATSPKQTYPTVYLVHGYGGSRRNAWTQGAKILEDMKAGRSPEMIYVFLDGTCPLGHHEFADSANNGPWGRALTTELVPYLEKQFRMDATPRGRLLTGHSSGGWSTLWLAINYPDVFGATWSTSPDPVDFRNFTGPDLTRPETENVFRTATGEPRNLVRMGGRDVMSLEQFALLERVTGDYGGQFASFDAVFSPKGEDGRPMPMFDRETGRIDPVVAKAWEKYDISRVLRDNWKRLGPKLAGRIHIVVGSADTFHLEEAVYLLRDELAKLGSDARIEVVEGRDHMNLYEGGLAERLAAEMYAFARPSRAARAR